ncbi:hypothetical protein BGW41_005052 [Actinomortierella wolfii]|nr:hypothetical protein BGW41_005052 [Actinomortierella wolfii]
MSNILAPIVSQYRAFFTVVMFSSSRLVRSANANQFVQRLVIDAQDTYQTLILKKIALNRNSSKSSTSSASSSSAASSPARSTLSSLDTELSLGDNDHPKDATNGSSVCTLMHDDAPAPAGPDASDLPQRENPESPSHAEMATISASAVMPHTARVTRIKSSATLMSLAIACVLLGLLQARRRNLKRMRRLLRNSQRLSKRGSRLGSSTGGHSTPISQRSTPAHSMSRRHAIPQPTVPFALERIPSESRVNAWLEDQESEQFIQQQPQQQHLSQSLDSHAYYHQYSQYPDYQYELPSRQSWLYQAQYSSYSDQLQPNEQYQTFEHRDYTYSQTSPTAPHYYYYHYQRHPASAVAPETHVVDQSWEYSSSYGYQYNYDQHALAAQQYPQYQTQPQYAHQVTLDHDYDHTPGHRRSLSLTNVGSTYKPIHTTPAPHSPTALNSGHRDSFLPNALEPEVLGTGTMSPAELAREQHRLHRERYQLHHQQLKQQQQQQQMPHQHYYHRSASPIPVVSSNGRPIRGMSPSPTPAAISATTIYPMSESLSISHKRTAHQLAWDRHNFYQQQQFEEDARVERDAQMAYQQQVTMRDRTGYNINGSRPVSLVSSIGSSSNIGRSLSDGRIHQSPSHPQRQYFGNMLHVENEAVMRTSSLSRSVASSLSPHTAQALGIQRARTTGSAHRPEKRWSGWFSQRSNKGSDVVVESLTSCSSISHSGGMIERVIRKASVRFRKPKSTPPPLGHMDRRPLSLACDIRRETLAPSTPTLIISSDQTVDATTTTVEPTITDPAEARKSMSALRGLSPSLPSLRSLARRCTLSARPKSYAAPSSNHHHSLSVLALEAQDNLSDKQMEDKDGKEKQKVSTSSSLGVINAKTKARHQSISLSETSLAVLKEAEQQKQGKEGQEVKYFPPTGAATAAVNQNSGISDSLPKEKPRVHRRVTLNRSNTVGRPRSYLHPQQQRSSGLSSSPVISSSLMLPGFGDSMRLANGRGIEFSKDGCHSSTDQSTASLLSANGEYTQATVTTTTATGLSAVDSEESRRTNEQVATLLAAASRRNGTASSRLMATQQDQVQQQQQQPSYALSSATAEVDGDRTLVDPYADIAFMLVPKSKYAFQPLTSAVTAVVPPLMDYRQTCSVMGN